MSEFIDIIIGVCEEQFPRRCTNCGKRFETFSEYVACTKPIGRSPSALSSNRLNPMELISYANCRCGGTISLQCTRQGSEMHKLFGEKVKENTRKAGVTEYEILGAIRDVIRLRKRLSK